jgi:hypothetical protein
VIKPPEDEAQEAQREHVAPPAGPWGGGVKPFLPPIAPINLGGGAPPAGDEPGPWGPHGKN